MGDLGSHNSKKWPGSAFCQGSIRIWDLGTYEAQGSCWEHPMLMEVERSELGVFTFRLWNGEMGSWGANWRFPTKWWTGAKHLRAMCSLPHIRGGLVSYNELMFCPVPTKTARFFFLNEQGYFKPLFVIVSRVFSQKNKPSLSCRR